MALIYGFMDELAHVDNFVVGFSDQDRILRSGIVKKYGIYAACCELEKDPRESDILHFGTSSGWRETCLKNENDS